MSRLMHAALIGAVLMLAGCEDLDPYHKPYVWYPTGASEANLAAQLANPNDLIRGRGVTTADGNLAAAAVTRAREDKAKPLPNPGAGGGGAGGG
jgi:type IV pilus biogenesis protein CpaD/CtpE